MAVIVGTSGADFIHRAGDGETGPGHEITGVTRNKDIITAGGGADIVYADKGNDIFVCAVSDINGLAEQMFGGAGNDTLRIESGGGLSINLTKATLVSVERLVMAPDEPELHTMKMTPQQLGGFNVISGIEGDFGIPSLDIHLSQKANLTRTGLDYSFLDIFGSNGADKINLSGDMFRTNILGGKGNDTITIDSDTLEGVGIGGGAGNDRLTGTGNGNHLILGGDGNDKLFGGDGDNDLDGEEGDDILTGGRGADFLPDSNGADTFVYMKLTDSLPGAGKFDNISFFGQEEGNRIDLHAIDADTTEGGDQPFHLGGSTFSNDPGELIQNIIGGSRVRLEGDVDGDGDADFAIEFTYFGTPLVLVDGDFVF